MHQRKRMRRGRAMRTVDYSWRLRQVMAERGIYHTTKLSPLLAERGVELSSTQVFRLVTGTPQRVNMRVLATLCDALDCTPNDLVVPVVVDQTGPPGPPPARR